MGRHNEPMKLDNKVQESARKSEWKDKKRGGLKKAARNQNKQLVQSLMQPCNKQNYRSAWLRFTFLQPQKPDFLFI